MSGGMAAGVGWIPAAILCVLLGGISGITFYLCARPAKALARFFFYASDVLTGARASGVCACAASVPLAR